MENEVIIEVGPEEIVAEYPEESYLDLESDPLDFKIEVGPVEYMPRELHKGRGTVAALCGALFGVPFLVTCSNIGNVEATRDTPHSPTIKLLPTPVEAVPFVTQKPGLPATSKNSDEDFVRISIEARPGAHCTGKDGLFPKGKLRTLCWRLTGKDSRGRPIRPRR